MSTEKIAIYALVREWFKNLNDHAPIGILTDMLCADGFEMKFPEAVITDAAGFEKWYTSVSHAFFDQVHDVKNIEIDLNGDEATLAIYVNWLARTWKAPAGYSEPINSDAFQVWKVVRESGGRWKIKTYAVESLISNL